MRDIDVFICLTILQKEMPFIDNLLMKQALSYRFFHITPDLDDIEKILLAPPPKTTHLVKRLTELGFSNKKISELLDIKHPSIIYHQKREVPEYRNRHLVMMRGEENDKEWEYKHNI